MKLVISGLITDFNQSHFGFFFFFKRAEIFSLGQGTSLIQFPERESLSLGTQQDGKDEIETMNLMDSIQKYFSGVMSSKR